VRNTGDPDVGEVMKALSNETRLRILEWLKEPKANFDRQDIGDMDEDGVCVSLIQKKTGLSQSTTSHFLAVLTRAGLVRSKRIGQWTFYKRDEDAIRRFTAALSKRIAP
jgi:ArsR family transcriptional regulator